MWTKKINCDAYNSWAKLNEQVFVYKTNFKATYKMPAVPKKIERIKKK